MIRKLFFYVALLFLFGSIWWSADVQQIGAGVAIFLFGMLSMDEGFKVFTGGTLERLLSKSTDKAWKALVFGIVTTTLVQSSSLVSVITISFLSSGLLELVRGIGIIFGANIGTTTGAWLVSAIGLKVKISAYAMPMLIMGIVLVMQSSKKWRGIGHILTGLGFLFLGIHFMKEGFEAFRSAIDLSAYALTGWQGLVVYTFFGVLATVIMQSSHATLVLIITALATSQISYENAIALAIGANIGTTVTAVIGAISANAAGKRLAAAHLVFNGVTALCALILLQPLIASVDVLSNLFGIGATEYALKLSLFHTLFNVLGVVLMWPFIKPLSRRLTSLISDDRREQLNIPAHRPDRRSETVEPRFISSAVMSHPDVALNAILLEVRRLWDNTYAVMSYALFLNRSDLDQEQPMDLVLSKSEIHDDTTDVDELYSRYLRPLNASILEASNKLPANLSEAQHETLFALKVACRDLMSAAKDVKHLQKNLLKYQASDKADLKDLYHQFRLNLATLLQSLQNILNFPDEEEALLAFSEQQTILKRQDILANGTLDRLVRTGAIDKNVIPSLMNDSQYCLNIGMRLIHMAQKLYWAASGTNTSVTSELVLTEDDVAEISE